MKNPKNLVQILKYIRNQDQNHKAFSFLPTNETWEGKIKANAVPQNNGTGIYKPKPLLLWTVPTSELPLSVRRDAVKNQRTALMCCTKVSAFKVLCPFLNVYILKDRLKMGFCVYLYRSYCKTIIGNQSLLSAVVFRCHHRELTEYFWRKAEKQHLCQQASLPKKSCKPIFQVLVDTTKAFKCPHPA